MKQYLISILLIGAGLSLQAQTATFTVTDSICSIGYDLLLDGVELTRIAPCAYEAPQIQPGQTIHTLSVSTNGTAANNTVTTLDLVNIQRGLLFDFDSGLHAYLSDWDGDGVISTEDLIGLRDHMLGIVIEPARYHVIMEGQDIPTIDPFDIQADFSTLEVAFSDFDPSTLTMAIKVLQIGDLDY